MSTHVHLDRKWTLDYPALGTEPVSTEPYLSPEFFALERERIFRRSWLCIGRVDEVPASGDFFVKDIAACDASLLVTRDRDGVIRAFHNVCTHRCNKLVWESCGTAQSLVCRFHAWTFDGKGHLRGVPDEEMFYGFDRRSYGLKPVALDTWAGFIFVNLDPQPRQTLAEYLGELGAQHAAFPFDDMPLCYAWRAEVKANWKMAIEGSCETYHLAALHRTTAREVFTNRSNPFGRPVDLKLWERHGYIGVYGNQQYSPKPVETVAYKQSSLAYRAGDADQKSPGVNPSNAPSWAVDVSAVFPNFVLALLSDSYLAMTSWPSAVDRFTWEVRLYMRPAETAGQAFAREYSKCLSRDIWVEDAANMEAVYAGMKSRAVPQITFQDGEALLRHFYKVVTTSVR
ncbi:aromatic ring-hydroxylating oxygenase subunit alpha [Sorangium sp. So ce1099]|uniref:aromatic ring-hydroxylating oxygenase subunit alpha n=1 Tax=Sorangium sp. So ce1099 TaxID=3133331 RepID=UPI003F63875A